MIVALALIGALATVVLPLMLDRTRDLSFDETVMQIERAASVARSDAQRRSEPVLFEARWSEKDRVYRVGTAPLREQTEGTGEANIVAELPSFDAEQSDADTGADQLPSFQASLTLPLEYEIRRRIPDEFFESAGVSPGDSGVDELSFDQPEESGAAGGVGDDWAEPELPQRVVIALFLPDGTLMGEERLYLIAPGSRVAAITMNRWLGQVKVERVRLDQPASEEDEQDSGPQDEAAPVGETGSDESVGGPP